MDDFRLKVFIAAARTLSFTRAAEQLYISQPAVSKHVGELESRYKVQLFTRRGSRLELTDAGRTMLEAAGRLLDDYRRLEYEMSLCADQTGGELRLGASTTIAQYLLPPILAHFTARFPGVRVSMSSGNSAEVEQALGEHAVDLGLVESLSRRQGLHYTLFRPDELVLVARPGGKYARRETVTPEGAAAHPAGVARKRLGDARSDRRGPCGQRHPSLAVRCDDAPRVDRGDQGLRPQQRRHGHRIGDFGGG